ncbi:MAG: UDP-3-O-(3-hydroxymyristoyl)glucosamine N-acyltransferase [Planctomycetaceae bacterium]
MPLSAGALARLLNAELLGDPERVVADGGSLENAGPRDVTFVADAKNLRRLAKSRAGTVLVARTLLAALPSDLPQAVLLVDDPLAAIVAALAQLRPPRPRSTFGISVEALVSPSARIGEGTNIHPRAHVGDDAVIGANCEIHPGVVIGAGCRIGDEVTLHPHVVLYPDVTLGNRVTLHAHAVIGADGFGYRLVDGRHRKIPHFGTVRIEDDVEIGACTTVDRAMIGTTVVGEGTKLDNLVMIAHNCELGKHNLLVSQVGLAGSVTTGDYVVCAGHVGVADHVHLGTGCTVGSKSGVHKDVPPGETYIGLPAGPVAEEMKAVMAQKKLPEMRKQLRELEHQVEKLVRTVESLSAARSESASSESASSETASSAAA